MSYTSQQTQNQTLNGIISITDGTLTIENGTISNIQGLDVEGNATFNQDVHVLGDAVVDGLLTVGQAQSSYTPVFSNDLVNKTYTDSNDNLRILKSGDTMTGALSMSSNKITSLSNGTNSGDAVNKSQLDLKADKTYVDSQDNLRVLKSGDVMTDYLSLPEVRISSQTTSYNSGTIDNSNRTNTYAVFEPAGTGNDWAFLRQIGGENDIHLSLDFHDDDNDGKFSLRNIVSVANPDTIKPFFTSTPTGTGIFNPNNSTNITKHLNLETNSNGIWLNPYFSNGSYNPLVSAGGKAMIFSNGTKETGDLVIGPWSDFNKGIKIIGSSGNVGIGTTTPSELLDVNGNIKLSGTITRSAWNSGELIRSKIYNQNTDGAGNITIGAATTATWKAITFNIQNPTINQSVLTVEIDCPYIISGNEGDYITVRVFDATDAANNNYQYLVRKTQRFDQDIGGGTRSGPIFPIITSYTPSYALTTYSRSIYIEIANFSDDNVYICHYILNGNVTVQNTYTIKISEYKI